MLLLIWQEELVHSLKVEDPWPRLFLLRKCFSYRSGIWHSERLNNQCKATSQGNRGCEIWLQVFSIPSVFPSAYYTESLKGTLHVSLDGSKISQECEFQHQLVNSPEKGRLITIWYYNLHINIHFPDLDNKSTKRTGNNFMHLCLWCVSFRYMEKTPWYQGTSHGCPSLSSWGSPRLRSSSSSCFWCSCLPTPPLSWETSSSWSQWPLIPGSKHPCIFCSETWLC